MTEPDLQEEANNKARALFDKMYAYTDDMASLDSSRALLDSNIIRRREDRAWNVLQDIQEMKTALRKLEAALGSQNKEEMLPNASQ